MWSKIIDTVQEHTYNFMTWLCRWFALIAEGGGGGFVLDSRQWSNLLLDTDSATLRMSSTALNIVRLIRSTAAGKYMHHYFYDRIVLFMQNFIFFNLESALSIILYEEVSFVLSVR